MDWILSHLAGVLIAIGLVLLVIEVAVLSFAVVILFFIGSACIVTGILVLVGLLPETLIAAFASVAVLSLAFAACLWQPLKRLQNSSSAKPVKGDFIGHAFVLADAVSSTQFSSHRLSGIDWKVRSERAIPAGVEVEVVKVEVGMLTVAAKEA